MPISGLIFCRLAGSSSSSGGSSSSRPRFTPTTTTAAPEEDIVVSADAFFGTESLIKLVLNGHLEDAKVLIEEGADVNEQDVHGEDIWA